MSANAWELVRELAREHPDDDPDVLADKMIRRCTKRDLVPIVSHEIAHQQRALAAGREAAAFKELAVVNADSVTVPQSSDDCLAAFRDLFEEQFALGDGTKVTWKEATEQQHLQRVELLQKQRDGLDRAITRHLDAVRLLRERGALSLGQVKRAA